MSARVPKLRPTPPFVSGALLIAIGIHILAAPAELHASNGVEPGANVSLLDALEVPAGLLVAGVFIAGAGSVPRFADAATALAALIYLSYAGSRLPSMVVDGAPTVGLVQAAARRAVIGLFCLAVLLAGRAAHRGAV